jgi:hypothetical protein
MKSQNVKKENEKLPVVIRITASENRKMKNDNQTLLKAKEELALMNTKFTAD